MFVDASALVAILLKEPGADDFSDAIEAEDRVFTSPIAIYEVVSALMRVQAFPLRIAQQKAQDALDRAAIECVPITTEIAWQALAAFEKYGKGRGHKAQLNMGDCFSYACAKSLGVSLLYKGDDFAQTDLA